MANATFENHPTDPNKVILRKKPHLGKGRDYEEGFVDGMQHQMQSSVDKAVNAMMRPWLPLTDEEKKEIYRLSVYVEGAISLTEAKLKEKNT